jgi:hypothetical protein
MRDNPVDRFFTAIAGPRVRRIVVPGGSDRQCLETARPGDTITVLLEDGHQGGLTTASRGGDERRNLGVMFCRHQPGSDVRPLHDGLQTVVPKLALSGPLAVVKLDADLAPVRALVDRYARAYRDEWLFSIFSFVRMDHWDHARAFGPPALRVEECAEAAEPGDHHPPGHAHGGEP